MTVQSSLLNLRAQSVTSRARECACACAGLSEEVVFAAFDLDAGLISLAEIQSQRRECNTDRFNISEDYNRHHAHQWSLVKVYDERLIKSLTVQLRLIPVVALDAQTDLNPFLTDL